MDAPKPRGARAWSVPDCFIPADPISDADSHEAICVLNTAGSDGTLSITAFFEDRDPLRFLSELVPALRTRHIRTDSLRAADGASVPAATPYALLVTADLEVTVQYSRLDESTGTRALMTSAAVPLDDDGA